MRELTYNNSRKSMLPKDYTKSSKFLERNYAVLASIFASLGAFSIGTCIGWSSNAIHMLSSKTFPLTFEDMNTREVAWIVAVFALGAALSSLLTFKVWRFLGSKLAILIAAAVLVSSWILLSFCGQQLYAIIAARLLGGLAAGCLHFLLPIYVEDIASSELRITIDYIWHSFFALGITSQFLSVFLEDMQLTNILLGVAPVVLFSGFLFLPESPRYLCYKGESNAAKEILRKFRGINDDVDEDVNIWCNSKAESFSFRNSVRNPSSLRRLLSTLGLIIFDQLVGVWAALLYLSWIFRISSGDFSPEFSAAVVAISFLAGNFFPKLCGIATSDKPCLIWTGILKALSFLLLGTYIHYKGSRGGLEEYGYLPLACCALYVFLYGMGLNRITWTYIRIIIPKQRYFTTRSLCVAISWTVLVISARVYPRFIELVGIGWLFWFMALACLSLVLFTCIFVPNLDNLAANYVFDQTDSFNQDCERQSNSS